MLDRILTFALRVERDGQIEPCLMVERIGSNFFFQLRHWSERFRLLSYFKRGTRGCDGHFIPFRFRNERESLLRLFERAGFNVAARETGKCLYVATIFREKLRVDFGGAGGITFGQRCLSAVQTILVLCADGALREAFKECHHLTLGQRAHESIDW